MMTNGNRSAAEGPGIEAKLARQLRADSIRASTRAGSGHPTSSMSAADLMAVLVSRHFAYDWDRPEHDGNDHLIFSKGHASPLLYSIFRAVGVVSEEELLEGYRRFGQRLQGHPTPDLPWVDVATGSLGQGLPDGVGVALAGRYLDRVPYKVWVLCGDSEMAEGSMWEAIDKAVHYQLGNLVAIVDVNRLGQRGETELGWNVAAYGARVRAFGANAITIDGHDLDEIDAAFTQARSSQDLPTVIVARTIKGKGFTEVEDQQGWHGKAFPPDMAKRALAELGSRTALTVRGPLPSQVPLREPVATAQEPVVRYEVGEPIATRKAYGAALRALGSRSLRVVALDGEVSNSTFTDQFAAAYPERYLEMYIAEQQLVAAAVGLSVRHYIPFASTFAAFFTRAHDFIRMAAISGASIRLVGSHAGVEIGEDGPSQMALEDLSMMRSVHGSTVLYPCDGTSASALMELMAELEGVSYMRTTRGAYPVLYDSRQSFHVGGSHTLRELDADQVTLVGAGVTVHECLAAADELAERNISARVIDLYSVKPVDAPTLVAALSQTDGRLVVVEDHRPEGGLASSVLEAVVALGCRVELRHLAVRDMPGSGRPSELLAAAGIDAAAIVKAVGSFGVN